jgi:hypothetical protein
MGDSNSRRPGIRPGGTPSSAPSPAASEKPAASPDEFAGKAGRIVHDERGNAIWSWIKETSRAAIESTSHLLKKLEVPELTMEDTQKNELKLESDRDAGGGYNPYGGSTSGGKAAPPRGSVGGRSGGATPGGTASARTSSSGSSSPSGARGGSNAGNSNVGGGYDPYGKSVTRKPGR